MNLLVFIILTVVSQHQISVTAIQVTEVEACHEIGKINI